MAKQLLKYRRYHVDLTRTTKYMGRTIRTIARLGMAWLAALSMLTAAYAQTAEQLRQLDQLSPAQRAALFEALDQQQSTQQAPLSEPTVVYPRRVAQPPLTSTETQEGQGDEDLTDSTVPDGARPELKPFGYDLFAGAPTTFAPATDIPVPVDYIIGPGFRRLDDELIGEETDDVTAFLQWRRA